MDMIGEQFIALPQQRVWEALNDPQVLKDCIPGVQSSLSTPAKSRSIV